MYIKYMKRFIDIFISLIVIFIISPILIIGLVLLIFDVKILFLHNRIGIHGKSIKVIKFKSMINNAEDKLDIILKTNPILREQWERHHKLNNDPRVTRLGKFLREKKLDELPQFINVFFGDMSFVGPRPLTDYEFKHKFKSKKAIQIYQSVRPGITGSWQVSYTENFDERINVELRYVNERSFLIDLFIVFKTIKKILIS